MKKNILLVMPKFPYTADGRNYPPSGICYISSAMKKAGLSVFNLNLNLTGDDIKSVLEQTILEHDIHFLGTGGMVFSHPEIEEVVHIAKEVRPSIFTFIGGSLVTHSPKEAMNLVPHADFGIIGEGDVTDIELVEALMKGEDLSLVDSIIFRCGEELVLTRDRQVDVDLNALTIPDYEGFRFFDLGQEERASDSNIKLVGPLCTSRSCPYQCTFCSRTGKGAYRTRDLDLVFEEMEYLIEKFGINEFRFADELFAQDTQRVTEFCTRIKPMNLAWEIYLRVSSKVTLELLQMMSDAGCSSVFYGLESACDKVLKSMKKGISEADILRVLTATKEVGMVAHGGFIFGDTAETKETVEYTLNFVEKHYHLMADVYFAPIMLLPGSLLYHKAIEDGKITDTTKFIAEDLPLINVSGMSEDEYNEMVFQTIPQFTSKLKKTHYVSEFKALRMRAEEGIYYLEYPCEVCGKTCENTVESKDIWYYRGKCPHCDATRHFALSCLYMREFQKDLSAYANEEGVAFWGLGNAFYDFYQSSSEAQERALILIDKNPKKQKIKINQSSVHPPDVIESRGIETVVITTANYLHQVIRNQIKKQFPSVKKVVWIYDVGLNENTGESQG